jgi:hypothetical protein
MSTVEPARSTAPERVADVLVAGGGPAGLAAAVAAARNGADTLLVERYGFLGGNMTAGYVNPFMPYYAGDEQLIRGAFQELVDRLQAKDAWNGQGAATAFDPEAVKFVADEMCRESGVRLLLHSFVAETARAEAGVDHLLIANKSGLRRIAAAVYVDATGDADIAAAVGPTERGRPEDGLTQPMTLNFRMADVDIARLPPREEINRLFEQAKAADEVSTPRENVLFFPTTRPGVLHFNTTRVVKHNGISAEDLTDAEVIARRQVQEIVAFLRRRVPGFENAYLQSMGTQIGVRETRRIVGEYVMTADDVLTAHKFADGIARGNYDIDIHSPTGAGTVIKSPPPGTWYEIPYRCLIPRGVRNLLVAGRPISTTHEAHASTRIMPICMALGEAAGTAAAICVKHGLAPPDLDRQSLRQTLREQGAAI